MYGTNGSVHILREAHVCLTVETIVGEEERSVNASGEQPKAWDFN